MNLYRDEMAEAPTAHWLRDVHMVRPLSLRLVSSCTFGLAFVLVALNIWCERIRRARLSGLLVPTVGALNVTTPQGGTVVHRPVNGGQTLQAEDVLLVIKTERTTMRGCAAEDSSAHIDQQIAPSLLFVQTELGLRALQTRKCEHMLGDLECNLHAESLRVAEVGGLQQRHELLANTTLGMQRQRADDDFVAAAQMLARQQERIEAKARLQSGQRMAKGVRRNLKDTLAERHALAGRLAADSKKHRATKPACHRKKQRTLRAKMLPSPRRLHAGSRHWVRGRGNPDRVVKRCCQKASWRSVSPFALSRLHCTVYSPAHPFIFAMQLQDTQSVQILR